MYNLVFTISAHDVVSSVVENQNSDLVQWTKCVTFSISFALCSGLRHCSMEAPCNPQNSKSSALQLWNLTLNSIISIDQPLQRIQVLRLQRPNLCTAHRYKRAIWRSVGWIYWLLWGHRHLLWATI